jgi:hypothetical protein
MPIGVVADPDNPVIAVLANFPALIDPNDGQVWFPGNLSVFDCSHTFYILKLPRQYSTGVTGV